MGNCNKAQFKSKSIEKKKRTRMVGRGRIDYI